MIEEKQKDSGSLFLQRLFLANCENRSWKY